MYKFCSLGSFLLPVRFFIVLLFYLNNPKNLMGSLKDLWDQFSLSEKEGKSVDLGGTPIKAANMVCAKFLMQRTVNVESIANTFKPLWCTSKAFTVQDMGKNKVVFSFEDAADMERVLMSEPWTFDKHLVVLRCLIDDAPIDELIFNEMSFWVQIHGLSIRAMTEEAASAIGQTLGNLESVANDKDNGGRENYMQVRVRMNINHPLCRGRKVALPTGGKALVRFKYKRLSNFCYWCGLLTHAEQDCDEWLRHKEE